MESALFLLLQEDKVVEGWERATERDRTGRGEASMKEGET